jgi:hypothetical protein
MVAGSQEGGDITRPVLFVLATLSYLVCLPYALYLVIEIINPQILTLQGWGPKLGLVAAAGFFLAAGYGAGVRNDLFMTCHDFEISGDTPPSNCRSAADPAGVDQPHAR